MNVRDHMTLRLAAAHYRYPAVRETHAAEQLGYTPTRFWQRVNWLLDQPEALMEYPREVRRLRRLREARELQREWSRVLTCQHMTQLNGVPAPLIPAQSERKTPI